ncbi:MAG: serine/threonine protein kinase [Acidobacteria bacterium]|nr:serine/threonine protein kinase [Acidobacteriota bacterium]
MEAERWRQISELAALAAEMAAGEREALLAGHPELRNEVESLLRYGDESTGPLDRGSARQPAAPLAGQTLGAYRLIREIGHGGMGVVYLAERTDPQLKQTVAIKLARTAFQSDFFVRRFVEERQILARLEHPRIARLLDGGLSADGSPYLVMPYVEGKPLDVWCRERQPDLAARLELFLKICSAVKYAHENLVVHRDLKPANILVSAEGEPTLLDFGTARLLEAAAGSGQTRTALPMVTVRYASPEQIGGLAGSTRSDVYSLGVILYELLTGQWPYEEHTGAATQQMLAIVGADPIPPSRRGAGQGRELAGDVDAIALKSLEKAPERRYGSVGEFSDDLQRYLNGEPVQARTPSAAYRAGKFLRRHRWAASAVAVVGLSLAAATVVSVRQARIADRERVKAEETAKFLERLLGASRSGNVTPLASKGKDVKVVEVIDDASATVGKEFENTPEVEAGLRSTIASTYMALGEYDKAKPHVERAVTLTERLYGEKHAATARALTARGRLRMAAGEFAGARVDFQRSLVTMESQKSPDLPFHHSLLGEAAYRLADLQAARRHMEDSLAGMRKLFGTNHLATATLINNLAVITDEGGDAPAAFARYGEAASILRALPGPPPNLVHPLIGLQRGHLYRGEYAKAKAVCEEAYRVSAAQGGERNRNAATALIMLSLVKAHLGEIDAGAVAGRAAGIHREIYPKWHPEIARALTLQGRVLLLSGKTGDAESVLREAQESIRKVYPKANWRPAEAQLFWGFALAAGGRREEARAALDAALREFQAQLPVSHPRVEEAKRVRGCALDSNKPGRACLAGIHSPPLISPID